jgi:hypothetical protein
MEILYTNCAGLDVHKKTVKVCVLIHASNGQTHKEFCTYFTTTEELLKLCDWLKEQGCTHIGSPTGLVETRDCGFNGGLALLHMDNSGEW